MSEKYIRVEDAIHMLESTGTLCGFGKYLLENPPSYCPTYSPADILAGQWVPVDKPPDNMRDVPVTAFWHENWQTLIGWYDGKWHVQVGNDHVRDDMQIVSWMNMPLPEPPKEAQHA